MGLLVHIMTILLVFTGSVFLNLDLLDTVFFLDMVLLYAVVFLGMVLLLDMVLLYAVVFLGMVLLDMVLLYMVFLGMVLFLDIVLLYTVVFLGMVLFLGTVFCLYIINNGIYICVRVNLKNDNSFVILL